MSTAKRALSDGEEAESASKVAKTAHSHCDKTAKVSKDKHHPVSKTTFHAEALPIHANFTHTPPSLIENEEQPTVPSDPGHIGAITLLPTDFSTGSYGWKGSRRMTIELQGSDGEKKTVQVMLNVNAAVIGSKDSRESAEEKAGAGSES